MDHRTGDQYYAASRPRRTKSSRMDAKTAAGDLPNARGAAAGGSRYVFCRLARASELRRILEALVDRGSQRANPSAGFWFGGVVRHFSGRHPTKLRAPEKGSRHRASAARAEADGLRWRPRGRIGEQESRRCGLRRKAPVQLRGSDVELVRRAAQGADNGRVRGKTRQDFCDG